MHITKARKHPRPVGRAVARRWIGQHGNPVEFASTNADTRRGSFDEPVAVISDVHANLPALAAVLADIDARGIGRVWCLGDTVGYGAQPLECLRLVRERCELVLAGNHDLAVTGDEPLARFGEHARPGVQLAVEQLRDAPDGGELLEWLTLRLTEVVDARRSAGFHLAHERQLRHHDTDALHETRIVAAHACPAPFDSVWDYLGHDVDALRLTHELGAPPLILVGHAHGQVVDAGVCNPGSVGQPRDDDPRAAWAELSSTACGADEFLPVRLHRTTYDVERAQAALRDAALPVITIERLAQGW